MRYRVAVIEAEDGFNWIVDALPVDYDGCDGMCTYGCGADPWVLIEYGMAETEEEASQDAQEALSDRR